MNVNVFRVSAGNCDLKFFGSDPKKHMPAFPPQYFKRRPYNRSASFLENTKSVSAEALELTGSCDFGTLNTSI